MKITKEAIHYLWERKNGFGFTILIIILCVYIFFDYQYITENKEHYIMPTIVTLATFLTWLQFIFYRGNKRKESALTYFPKPMELEKIENEIDKVLQIWIGEYPINSYEVKLMIGEKIKKEHYKLIWNTLSYSMKVKVISEYTKIDESFKIKRDLKYDKNFNRLIDETYFDIRRKVNLYLNQIEGYCLALNNGNIDKDVAYDMFSYKFPHFYDKVFTYISMTRKKKGHNDLYSEFEKIVHEWKNK
ncbi:DUF4760 domain-containing protein [Aliarcobacter lanthieri]|uniref:DUF4760 domain-containing protein n=1 Tax=Aliarcobacter lanthieri TaxID=1355374 RepID=UPI003AAE3F84